MAILDCKTKATRLFLAGERVREFQGFSEAAAKALTKLQAAVRLFDLRNPPSNGFEALGGERKGQYSIRINRQFRVCFVWVPHEPVPEGVGPLQLAGDADQVEIIDYH